MKPRFVRNACLPVLYAVPLFMILLGIAIAMYPGGTIGNSASHGYSWTRNYFSDLGRSKLFDGQSNTSCMILFSLAMTVVGAALIPFFVAWQVLFSQWRKSWPMAAAGSLCGVVAAAAYWTIAIVPWNIHPLVHLFANKTAFFAMMLMSVLYSAAMVGTGKYPKIGTYTMIFFALACIGYVWLLFFGPSFTSPEGSRIQVMGQKAIVALELAILFLQAVIARNAVLPRPRQFDPRPAAH